MNPLAILEDNVTPCLYGQKV